ncbi:MAG: SPOR domain-containing protein [Halioglobus sp.]
MSDRDDDSNQEQDGDQAGNNWNRNENLFNDFDNESEFEDSDRDSDFATMYTEVDEEEPEADEPEPLEPPMEESTWELEEEVPADTEQGTYNDPWEESEAEEAYQPDSPIEPDLWDSEPNPPGAFDDEPPESESSLPPLVAPITAEDDDLEEDWEEMEEEEDYEEDEASEMTISLGMIIVAVVALVLLGAGGYGVIEQRATMQEEIRQLQAKLATSAPPKDVAASRAAVAEASERNELLAAQMQELSRENSSLQAIVAGLEKQLAAQQAALAKPILAPKQAPAKPTAPTKPAATKAAASGAAATGWFVNFSSYSKQSTAESWVNKLQPSSGRVIVATGQSNGRTIYRVRVVDLASRDTAEAIARTLEKEHGLPKLWIGKSD